MERRKKKKKRQKSVYAQVANRLHAETFRDRRSRRKQTRATQDREAMGLRDASER